MLLNENDRIKGSFFGFFVGDALGVPAEFVSRETLEKKPISTMEEYGSHFQPKGTWSDDTSMVIATTDAMAKNQNHPLDYLAIMNNFLKWANNGEFTPFHEVFDIGNSTSAAIHQYQMKLKNNHLDYKCGDSSINSNGNGSLMRILPVAIYLHYSDENMFKVIAEVSSMTHAHIYSILSCYFYAIYIDHLFLINDKLVAYQNAKEEMNTILTDEKNAFFGNLDEIRHTFKRIFEDDITCFSNQDIRSSGYVIDTLEAAFWYFLTTNNYQDAVLKAVNLGNDTDTIAAITGSLAGFLYGYEAIPKEWIHDLQQNEMLDHYVNEFEQMIEYQKRKKALTQWQNGLGDMNKVLSHENPMPSKKVKATSQSWKNLPFNGEPVKTSIHIELTNEQFEIISQGHIPRVMEDHWFMYCDDFAIHYFRSWTGFPVFKAFYRKTNQGYEIYALNINTNDKPYNNENMEKDKELFKNLIFAECQYPLD